MVVWPGVGWGSCGGFVNFGVYVCGDRGEIIWVFGWWECNRACMYISVNHQNHQTLVSTYVRLATTLVPVVRPRLLLQVMSPGGVLLSLLLVNEWVHG